MTHSFSSSKLRELMKTQGRQTQWLAEVTAYEPETVSRFLNGSRPISEKFACRAAMALGIPVTWLAEDRVPAREQVPA